MKTKIWMLAALLMFALGQASAAEKVTYYHLDALGSPIAATDANGNLAWKEAYKPYGERIRKEDGGSNNTWYTGKQEDEDNGLTYFGARWYDPTVGRFMGIDPVGVQEENIHSFNRFAYANNNPYSFVDPDGKNAVWAGRGGYALGRVTVRPAINWAINKAVGGGATYTLGTYLYEVFNESGNADSGSAKDNSRKKRRAARKAQREHGTPTSTSGENQQGRPGTPRHQIKTGPDGAPDGVVDGSNDTVDGHGPHIEVGDIKTREPINKHGQPRLKNGKSKVDI